MGFTYGRNRPGEGTPVRVLYWPPWAPQLHLPGEGEGLEEETWGAGASPTLGPAMEGVPFALHLPRDVWGAPRVVSW